MKKFLINLKIKKILLAALSLILVLSMLIGLWACSKRPLNSSIPGGQTISGEDASTNGSSSSNGMGGSTTGANGESGSNGFWSGGNGGGSSTGGSGVTQAPTVKGNLALGNRYQYSYPGLRGFSGDPNNTVLTDGTVKKGDVGGNGWLLSKVFNEDFTTKDFAGKVVSLPTWSIARDPNYSITMDLGYVCDVQNVAVTFGENDSKKISLPKGVEIFLSNDGYNYTMYPMQTSTVKTDGNVSVYTIAFSAVQKAKSIKIVVYASVGTTSAIGEVAVNGAAYRQKKLLSKGASYRIKGTIVDGFEDKTGKKLTDGVKGALDNTSAYVGVLANQFDDLTTSFCAMVDIDLGGVKNLSEANLESLFKTGTGYEPKYIAVYYSENGSTYNDFGTGAVSNAYGNATTYKSVLTVTRNHTVRARYVRIKVYGTSTLLLDEIQLYGCDAAVAEPSYNHTTKNTELAHTNVLELKPVNVDGSKNNALTDLVYMNDSLTVTKSSGKTVIEATLDKTYSQINSVALYFRVNGSYKLPTSVKTYVSTGDGKFTLVSDKFTSHEVAGRAVVRELFGDRKAKVIKIEVQSPASYQLAEVSAYNAQPQLPVIDGGFTNPNFSNAASNEGIAYLDDYMWYILLKGMKDLGMDRIVVPYTTNKRSMQTLIQGNSELAALGYKTLKIHNSKDPTEAMMKAADKLKMKVFMGTCLGVGYPNVPNEAYHDEVIAAAKITIKALATKYGKHSSFYGYYFSDETCDAWLAQKGAIATFRKIYKSQSDYIRQNYPGKKTMICPAIWRSGTPASAGQNIYNLIKGDTASSPPIVDFVAQQDCLGRPYDFILPNAIYESFEKYEEEWARGVRAAGAEFWNDLEVFNGNAVAKNIPDTINALEIESKYTNGNIVFDIVNYFSPLCQTGRIDNVYRGVYSWEYAQQDYCLNEYVKYYHTLYATANTWGAKATSADGTTTKLPLKSSSDTGGGTGPKVEKPVDTGIPLSGSGIIKTTTVPSMGYPVATSQWGTFQNFKSSSVQYAMVYDNDFLYVGIKTNDTTQVTGTLANWSASKADMVQVFLTGKGNLISQISQISTLENALRMSFTRTAASVYGAQTHLQGTKSSQNGVYVQTVIHNGKPEIIIAISWKDALGMSTPKSGDKVGIKVLYYDATPSGTVSTTYASSKGGDIASDCLFTLG